MARATANCTCVECGVEFTKTKTCYNRTDADSWEAWAVQNFTQCPSCWGKEQRKKEAEKPLTLNVSLNPYNSEYPAVLYFSGDTMTYKDQIKELGGYWWGEKPVVGAFGLLDTKQPQKCWNKVTKVEEIDADIKAAESIGAKIVNNINEIDIATFAHIKAEADKKAEKIAAIKKPVCPEILKGKRWNGKFYGKSGSYCVYLDNEKTLLTDDNIADIERYLKEKEEYEKLIQELEMTL